MAYSAPSNARCISDVALLLSIISVSGAVGDVPLAPSAGVYRSRYVGRCERITIPLCLGMKYNMTRMPNLVGHTSQAEAAMQVHEFVPLIQFGCSRLLKFFLCSLYAPMCTIQVDEPMVIPACRSMCLEVRDKCEPILERFNFHWPSVLDCAALPERSDRGSLCIDLPPANSEANDDADPDTEYQPAFDISPGEPIAGPSSRVAQKPDWTKLLGVLREGGSSSNVEPTVNAIAGGLKPTAVVGRGSKAVATPPPSTEQRGCPDRFMATVTGTSISFNGSHDVTMAECAARCSVDVMFRAADKEFISTWMTVWATVSLASSVVAALTFLIEPARFDYPERPVIFIAICYAFYSSAFIVRAVAGPEMVSCDRPRGGVTDMLSLPADMERYVIREGLESVWCLVVFLILYYFGTAGVVWWALLSITWYLASARKWSREAIRSYAGYIHLVGWSAPAVQTIVVLAIRRVDGDEMTGLCYVGNQDATALAGFVLVPHGVYLVIGAAFIGLGFLALFGVRQDLKQADHRPTVVDTLQSTMLSAGHSQHQVKMTRSTATSSSDVHKLEKLMARIGLLSVIYVGAMCCHLAALFYQQVRVAQSIETAKKTPCRVTPSALLTGVDAVRESCALDQSLQSVEIHALKICSPLVIGVASGLWMMSKKTLRSWTLFLCRCRQVGGSAAGAPSTRARCDQNGDGGRYPTQLTCRTLPCRTARVQATASTLGRPIASQRAGPIGGRSSNTPSYAALNKGEALSLTTII